MSIDFEFDPMQTFQMIKTFDAMNNAWPIRRPTSRDIDLTDKDTMELANTFLEDVKFFLEKEAPNLSRNSDYVNFICDVLSKLLAYYLTPFYKIMKFFREGTIENLDDRTIEIFSSALNLEPPEQVLQFRVYFEGDFLEEQKEILANALVYKTFEIDEHQFQVIEAKYEANNYIAVKAIPRSKPQSILYLPANSKIQFFYFPISCNVCDDIAVFPILDNKSILNARLLKVKKEFELFGISIKIDNGIAYYKTPFLVRTLNLETNEFSFHIPFQEELQKILDIEAKPADLIIIQLKEGTSEPQIDIEKRFKDYITSLPIDGEPTLYDFIRFLYNNGDSVRKLNIVLSIGGNEVRFNDEFNLKELLPNGTGKHFAIYVI